MIMKMEDGRFVVYGNAIKKSHSQAAIKWQKMFVRKFNYDPDEKYTLSLEENEYLGPIFGVKNIVRGDQGEKIVKENAVVCSTIRMGYRQIIELPWPASPAPRPWALRRIG